MPAVDTLDTCVNRHLLDTSSTPPRHTTPIKRVGCVYWCQGSVSISDTIDTIDTTDTVEGTRSRTAATHIRVQAARARDVVT